jgi:hypothetical protein
MKPIQASTKAKLPAAKPTQPAPATKPQAAKTPVPPKTSPPSTKAQAFNLGITSVKDIIAPGAIEVDFNYLKIDTTYFKTLFVSGYPRFVSANWLAPLINFEHSLNIAMFIYPVEGHGRFSRILSVAAWPISPLKSSSKTLRRFRNNWPKGQNTFSSLLFISLSPPLRLTPSIKSLSRFSPLSVPF